MIKKLLKIVGISGGIFAVTEFMDCCSKAQAFSATNKLTKGKETVDEVLDIMENSDRFDVNWYTKTKSKLIAKLTRLFIKNNI